VRTSGVKVVFEFKWDNFAEIQLQPLIHDDTSLLKDSGRIVSELLDTERVKGWIAVCTNEHDPLVTSLYGWVH
jgi:hypothetical protein